MKRKLVATMLAMVLALTALAGCGALAEGYNFIFVCPIVGLEYWNLCTDGIEAADAEFGTSTQVVGPTDATNFVTEVVGYMESAIATKPDLLCGPGFHAEAPRQRGGAGHSGGHHRLGLL